ncbi:hypothetical protein KAU33_09190 [Candidatus Dependentiae bacterium]|nr:hypothetical protein [Candidatus Dependentiae bacterium]
MISPDEGAGIEFEYDGDKCITLSRTDLGLYVRAEVFSYIGQCANAVHYYASLHISDLSCKIIGDESGETFSSNVQPKKSSFRRIDVSAPAAQDIYSTTYGRKWLDAKKGCLTSRFDSIEDCIEAVELTFRENFDPELWVLSGRNHEPWDKAKAELIKEYKEE